MQLQILAVVPRTLGNLSGKLTSGGQHQRARRAAGAVGGIGNQTLQNGQNEASGFTGAGLGTRQYVAAGKHRRDGLHLDG